MDALEQRRDRPNVDAGDPWLTTASGEMNGGSIWTPRFSWVVVEFPAVRIEDEGHGMPRDPEVLQGRRG